jgi:hypothetical protein
LSTGVTAKAEQAPQASASGVDARFAHHIAVLSDIGEPTQRFEVAWTNQGSLKWGGHLRGRTSIEYLSHRHVGLIGSSLF